MQIDGVRVMDVALADLRTIERTVLALVALERTAVDRFVLVGSRQSMRVVIRRTDDPAIRRARATGRSESWQILISEDELGYWISTLVRIFHGGSPVDHLDLELNEGGPLEGLMLRFPQTLPDLTPREAADRLGE